MKTLQELIREYNIPKVLLTTRVIFNKDNIEYCYKEIGENKYILEYKKVYEDGDYGRF